MKYTLLYWLLHFIIGRIFDFAPITRDFPVWIRLVLWYFTSQWAKIIVFRMCPEKFRLRDNEVCIITGASTGIGAECAKELYRRGGKVIWAARDVEKAQKYVNDLTTTYGAGPRGYVLKLDLANLESIRSFVREFRRRETKLNILILNAGYHGDRRFTKDGFEQHFGVNHLGHMYLTYLLSDMMFASAPGRVVVVSSDLHKLAKRVKWEDLSFEKDFSPFKAYNHSKLCNILFAKQLSLRWRGKGITVNSVHPGTPVQTELMRNSIWGTWLFSYVLLPPLWHLFCRQAVHGAESLTYCAVSEECATTTGFYYENCRKDKESKASQDVSEVEKLWNVSCDMLQIPQDWS